MAATKHGAVIGQFNGTSWASAFTNPQNLDLIQIIHPVSGSVVANVTSAGVAHNPAVSATTQALIGKYAGTSYATAFTNPGHDDLIQIYEDNSGTIIKYLDYQGNSH